MSYTDDQLFFLNSNLINLYDISIPLRRNLGKNHERSWFNFIIKQQIKTRDDIYKSWKRFITSELYQEYRKARELVNKTIYDAKSSYYENLLDQL